MTDSRFRRLRILKERVAALPSWPWPFFWLSRRAFFWVSSFSRRERMRPISAHSFSVLLSSQRLNSVALLLSGSAGLSCSWPGCSSIRLMVLASLTSSACITEFSQKGALGASRSSRRSHRKSQPPTVLHRNTASRMIVGRSLEEIRTSFSERQVSSRLGCPRSPRSNSTSARSGQNSASVTFVSPTKISASRLARWKSSRWSCSARSRSILTATSCAWCAPTSVCRYISPSRMYLCLDLKRFWICARVRSCVTLPEYFAATMHCRRASSLKASLPRRLWATSGWCSRKPSSRKCSISNMFIFERLRITRVAALSLFFVIQYSGLPPSNTHVSGSASRTLRGSFSHTTSCSTSYRQASLCCAGWQDSESRSWQRSAVMRLLCQRLTRSQRAQRQPSQLSSWLLLGWHSWGEESISFINKITARQIGHSQNNHLHKILIRTASCSQWLNGV